MIRLVTFITIVTARELLVEVSESLSRRACLDVFTSESSADHVSMA